MITTAPWLSRLVRSSPTMGEIQSELCTELVRGGVPLWRSALLVELLHPELSGGRYNWLVDREEIEVSLSRHNEFTDVYDRSPLKIVDDTNRTFRARLEGEPDAAIPLLGELKEEGGTDYVIIPLCFGDRRRSAAISFTTKQPGGFTDTQLQALEDCVCVVSPIIEVRVMRRIAIDLLDTYVGPRAGESILEGKIQRGHGGKTRAVVWYSDLRNFTALTEQMRPLALLATLNDYFEIVTNAAADAGGEVVQHVGDAAVIFFPIGEGVAPAHMAGRALEAARYALSLLDEHNTLRANDGLKPLKFGVGLDIGYVVHGNVGSSRRLSFNIVGTPVNRAARIESMTKSLSTPILMSADFAGAVACEMESVGHHELRGVDAPIELFRPLSSLSEASRKQHA